MATGSANSAYHSSITGTSTIDTVTLVQNSTLVEVYNRAAAGNLFFTTGPSAADPSINGNDCYIIPAGTSDTVPTKRVLATDNTKVKIISDTTAAVVYSVVAR